MLTFLLIILIIACALLIFIILAQNPKGGGVSNFGSAASQILGARQAPDALEKGTWYFGTGILVVVAISYFLTSAPSVQATEQSRLQGKSLPTVPLQQTPSSTPAAPTK